MDKDIFILDEYIDSLKEETKQLNTKEYKRQYRLEYYYENKEKMKTIQDKYSEKKRELVKQGLYGYCEVCDKCYINLVTHTKSNKHIKKLNTKI